MTNESTPNPTHTARVDGVPVLWIEPVTARPVRELILFLPPFTGAKEQMVDYLRSLAAAGFVAVSLDPWQQGERGTESPAEMSGRVFGAFRKGMWPILGQTTLDVLRVIEWAVQTLSVEPNIRIGGISMGGDIAVTVAGLEPRVKRVIPIVATPDWLRPGMRDAFKPERLIDQGAPDASAGFFYEALNPLTHLERYNRPIELHFICGAEDTHVPPDGAQRFQRALNQHYPDGPKVEVELIPGLAHLDVRDAARWWPGARQHLIAPWPA